MSLINKMLQDLDARGGGSPAASGAAVEVRAVAAPARSRSVAVAAGAVVAAVVLCGAAYFGWQYFRTSATSASAGTTAPAATAFPAAAAAPAVRRITDATQQGNTSFSAPEADIARGPGAMAATAASAPAVAGGPDAVRPRNADASHGTNRARRQDVVSSTHAAGAGAAENAAAASSAGQPEASAQGKVKRAASADKPSNARRLGAPEPGHGANAPASRAEADASSGLSSRQRAENEYRRALEALHDARISDAMALLEQAVYLYPRHEAARQTLIGLLVERKQYAEAIRHLQFAIGLDPRQSNMTMLLARLQGEQGGPAIETLQRGLQYANGNADYRALLAGMLQRAQRHKEAVEQYTAAVQLQPGQGVWWMGLGISLQAEQRKAEARDAFIRARDSGRLSAELQGFVERKIQQVAGQ